MTTTARLVVAFVLLPATLAAPLMAQGAERVRIGSIYESYGFGRGYAIESMSQLTIPVTLDVTVGGRASLVLSTGFMSVNLRRVDSAQVSSTLSQSTPLDTELRLEISVVPQRVIAFVAGTLPTARSTIAEDDLSLLVALTNDAVGFSVPSFGSGGSLSSGFSAALPLGDLALGTAATAVYSFPYQPVVTQPSELSPGAELRLRVGIEGPLSARTYVRVAGSLVARQRDELDGVPAHSLGRRLIGYANVEQGIGPTLLGLYVFNVFRGTPQLEQTALGVAVLPRGNLLVTGGSVAIAVGRNSSLIPGLEYRVAAAAPTVLSSDLVRQSSSLRATTEFRHQLRPALTLVLRGEGAFGDVLEGATYYGFSGFRGGVRLEVTP